MKYYMIFIKTFVAIMGVVDIILIVESIKKQKELNDFLVWQKDIQDQQEKMQEELQKQQEEIYKNLKNIEIEKGDDDV